MTPRKFYKTVIQVEVLSEEPLENCGLDVIDYMITEGDSSGKVTVISRSELDGKQAADELQAHGSDTSFFNLDDEGNDYE